MKTKKIKNRLTLNKKTIARLNDMGNLKGGVIPVTDLTFIVSVCLCDTDEQTICLASCPHIVNTCNCPTEGLTCFC